jgi:hypothetical protein
VQDSFLIYNAGEGSHEDDLSSIEGDWDVEEDSQGVVVDQRRTPLPGKPVVGVCDSIVHHGVTHMMLLGRMMSLTATRWYVQEHFGLVQGFIQVWTA